MGLSRATGERLRAAGKIQVIHLSAHRLGVTGAASAAFLAACESNTKGGTTA
jgi:hypothetical protein